MQTSRGLPFCRARTSTWRVFGNENCAGCDLSPAYHLAVLGSVDPKLVSKLSSTLHKIVYERSKIDDDRGEVVMDFTKPSVWPNSRKARTIVVESKPIPAKVENLARAIRTGLIPFYTAQTEQEHNQEFKPHITLMRLDRRVETPAEKLAFHRVEMRVDTKSINSLDELLPIRLAVENVCLLKATARAAITKFWTP